MANLGWSANHSSQAVTLKAELESRQIVVIHRIQDLSNGAHRRVNARAGDVRSKKGRVSEQGA